MNNLSKYSDKQLKNYRVVILTLGMLIIFLSILLLFVDVFFGLVFLILGLLCIKVTQTYKNELNRRETERSRKTTDEKTSAARVIKSDIPTTSEPVIDLDIVKAVMDKSVENNNAENHEIHSETVESDIKTKPSKEHHKIAGTSYRQNEIKSLGSENFEYQMSKSEIIDCGMEDTKIFELEFDANRVELIEEPDNEYDPKAVKVVIDGAHVGYIKKGSCSRIKKLLKDDKIASISANIFGGKYKLVYSDYDYDKDKDIYTLEKGIMDFFVSIDITLK